MPTVLELLGIEAPAIFSGVAQLPIHGTSLAYTFDAADAPTRKETQYFELLGDRGIWHRRLEGGRAAREGRRLRRRTAGSCTTWTRTSRSAHDLAAEQPEKLREMVERWWAEAGRYGVLPLDDREYERVAAERRGPGAPARTSTTPAWRGSTASARRTSPTAPTPSRPRSRSPRAAPRACCWRPGAGFGGYVLYVKDGRPVYEYAFSQRERHDPVTDGGDDGAGRALLRIPRTGPRRGRDPVAQRTAVGSVDLPKTWPIHGATAGVLCGHDPGAAVSDAYLAPFPFTGTPRRVIVEVQADGTGDPIGESRGALGEE